jgi:hypothetical protein
MILEEAKRKAEFQQALARKKKLRAEMQAQAAKAKADIKAARIA